MNCNQLRRLTLIAVIVAILAGISAPGTAYADASCSGLLSDKINNLIANGGAYAYTVTIVKDPLGYVTFAESHTLTWDGTWLHSPDNTQFGDRRNGGQNFNINEMEASAIWIDQTGHLWIHDDPYNYWIVSGYDMSCVGGLITKYVPGLGSVTVRIGAWHALYSRIEFTIGTGGDDARQDSEVVSTVNVNPGSPGLLDLPKLKISGESAWNNNTVHNKQLLLSRPVPISDIGSVTVKLVEHDSFPETDDNWNMDSLNVMVVTDRGERACLVNVFGAPFSRLTGSAGTITLAAGAGCP